jgi:hypothetical protein
LHGRHALVSECVVPVLVCGVGSALRTSTPVRATPGNRATQPLVAPSVRGHHTSCGPSEHQDARRPSPQPPQHLNASAAAAGAGAITDSLPHAPALSLSPPPQPPQPQPPPPPPPPPSHLLLCSPSSAASAATACSLCLQMGGEHCARCGKRNDPGRRGFTKTYSSNLLPPGKQHPAHGKSPLLCDACWMRTKREVSVNRASAQRPSTAAAAADANTTEWCRLRSTDVNTSPSHAWQQGDTAACRSIRAWSSHDVVVRANIKTQEGLRLSRRST